MAISPLILSLFLVIFTASKGAWAAKFTITNNCDFTVWPGVLSNADAGTIGSTGFALEKGAAKTLDAPSSWGGRFWGRTSCSTDSTTSKFVCAAGDCGSGAVECSGSGAAPPATLAEFKLDGSGGLDFYDVSLVDGYNLPILVMPSAISGGNCAPTGCASDINGACPPELRVTAAAEGNETVACKSACEAFGSPEYCCSGEFNDPVKCKPSQYAQFFKKACPRAYSYAYDDASSTFTCTTGIDYTITFCPSPSPSSLPDSGSINRRMVHQANGGGQTSVSIILQILLSLPSAFLWFF